MAVSMSCYYLSILAVVAVALIASSEARAADSPIGGVPLFEQMFGATAVGDKKNTFVAAHGEPAEGDSVSGGGSDAMSATEPEAWVSKTEPPPVHPATTELEAGAGVEESAGESAPKGAAELKQGGVEERTDVGVEERTDVDVEVGGQDGRKGGSGRVEKQTDLPNECNGAAAVVGDCKPSKSEKSSWSAKKFTKLMRLGGLGDQEDKAAEKGAVGGNGNEEGSGDVLQEEAKPREPTDKRDAQGARRQTEGGGEDGSEEGSGDVLKEEAKPSEPTDKHGSQGAKIHEFFSLAATKDLFKRFKKALKDEADAFIHAVLAALGKHSDGEEEAGPSEPTAKHDAENAKSHKFFRLGAAKDEKSKEKGIETEGGEVVGREEGSGDVLKEEAKRREPTDKRGSQGAKSHIFFSLEAAKDLRKRIKKAIEDERKAIREVDEAMNRPFFYGDYY